MKRFAPGYSLLETVMYTGFVVIIGGVVVALTLQMVLAVGRVRASTVAIDNARRAVDVIGRDVAASQAVYGPTSVFGDSAGQLSLVTGQFLLTGEPYTYVDYYIDDSRLFRKREGQLAQQITGDSAVVDSFTVTHINANPDQEAVRIEIAVSFDTPRADLSSQSQVTLRSTNAIRAYASN